MTNEPEKMKSIDEVFAMCESRYALVAMVSKRARELAEEAEKRNETMLEKPVNIVLNNLKSGRSTIARPGSSGYRDEESVYDIPAPGEVSDNIDFGSSSADSKIADFLNNLSSGAFDADFDDFGDDDDEEDDDEEDFDEVDE